MHNSDCYVGLSLFAVSYTLKFSGSSVSIQVPIGSIHVKSFHCQNSSSETEESHEQISGYPVSRPRYEPSISLVQKCGALRLSQDVSTSREPLSLLVQLTCLSTASCKQTSVYTSKKGPTDPRFITGCYLPSSPSSMKPYLLSSMSSYSCF
jgi:hypothetical protein